MSRDYAFLHGGIQGSWVWAATLEALGQQTDGKFGRALALDVPGCGIKHKRATEALTPDDVASELVDEIERAGLREVALVTRPHALAEALLFEPSSD